MLIDYKMYIQVHYSNENLRARCVKKIFQIRKWLNSPHFMYMFIDFLRFWGELWAVSRLYAVVWMRSFI